MPYRHTRLDLALMGALACAACDGPPPAADAGPPDAGPIEDYIILFPFDRTSSAGAEPELLLFWTAGALPSRMRAVHEALHLTREPEREEVPFSIQVFSEEGLGRSLVTPAEPLADGFYRLWVDELPPGVASFQTSSPDGTVGVRFAAHSTPHVVGVQSCLRSEEDRLLTLQFSEAMDPQTSEHVTFEGDTCTAPALSADGTRLSVTCVTREQQGVTAALDLTQVRGESGEPLAEAPSADAPSAQGRYAFDPLDAERVSPITGCLTTFAHWPTPY